MTEQPLTTFYALSNACLMVIRSDKVEVFVCMCVEDSVRGRKGGEKASTRKTIDEERESM